MKGMIMQRLLLALLSFLLAAFLLWRLRVLQRDAEEARVSPYTLQNANLPASPDIPASLLQEQPSVIEQPMSPDPDHQHYDDGKGPLFHRRYSIALEHAAHTREALMEHIKQNLHEFSPELLAKFEKTTGEYRQMQINDQYDITILGPWNGSVRVADVKADSFAFVTLEGHPEAGEIRFSIEPYQEAEHRSCFCIESLARSRDKLVALSYREAGIGLEVQRQTWVTFCERVAAYGGTALAEVEVLTEELTDD